MGLMQSKMDGDNIIMMMYLFVGREYRDLG